MDTRDGLICYSCSRALVGLAAHDPRRHPCSSTPSVMPFIIIRVVSHVWPPCRCPQPQTAPRGPWTWRQTRPTPAPIPRGASLLTATRAGRSPCRAAVSTATCRCGCTYTISFCVFTALISSKLQNEPWIYAENVTVSWAPILASHHHSSSCASDWRIVLSTAATACAPAGAPTIY